VTLSNYLFHPDLFFRSLHAHPQMAWPMLLIACLGVLSAAIHSWSERTMRALTIKPNPTTFRENLAQELSLFALLLAIQVAMSCVLLSVFARRAEFSWICSLTGYAFLPLIVINVPRSLFVRNWLIVQLSKWMRLASAVWMSVLLYIGLRLSAPLWWQALLLALPFPAVLGWLTVSSARGRPLCIFACLPWRRIPGERITLFYPPGMPREALHETLELADRALADIISWSGLDSLPYRVLVFMYRDEAELKRHVGSKDWTGVTGQAHYDAISMIYTDPDIERRTAVHEFAHVLLRTRAGEGVRRVLQEGFACLAERSLCGGEPCGTPVPVTWRTMARDSVFCEGQYNKDAEFSLGKCYDYASSMSKYLIDRFGFEKFYELCIESQEESEYRVGSRFAEAIQAVYHAPIDELEAAWRRHTLVEAVRADGRTHLQLSLLDASPVEIAQHQRILDLEKHIVNLQQRLSGQQTLNLDAPVIPQPV